MKLFVRRLTLYLIPIFILLLLTEVFTRALPNDYTYKRSYLDSNSNKIEVLILGNSHAYYDINPKYINQNCFNAAYVSQSINYDYEILKKYENRWSRLSFVCIPLDYFTLYNRLEYGSESFRTKNYVNYYLFPSKDFIWKNLEILNGKISQNYLRIWRAVKNRKKSGMNSVTCTSLGWGAWAKTTTDITISGKLAALRQKKNSNHFLKTNIKDINKIIEVLKSNNIQLILFTPPACKGYIQSFDSNQFETIKSIGVNLEKSNSNVKYFDFLTDPSFSEDDFHDGNHLCIVGAKKFSLKIDSVLNVLSSLKK